MSKKSLNVLLVEDDPGYSKLVVKALSRVTDPVGFNVICAKTFAAAIKYLGSKEIDIIILDIGLPDSEELEALRGFCELNPDMPVIVLTGRDDQELAISAIQEGARDYIVKQNFPNKSLPRIIRYAVEREYAYDRLRKNEDQLRNMFAGSSTVMYRCLFDNDWTMKFISDSIKTVAGYEASDFVRNNIRSFESIIHPDDRFKVYDTVKCDLADGQVYEVDYRIICADGKIKWIKDSGQAVIENGEVKELNGALIDIDEYKGSSLEAGEELDRVREELSEKNEKVGQLKDEVEKAVLMLEAFDTNVKITGYSESLLNELKDSLTNLSGRMERVFEGLVDEKLNVNAVAGSENRRFAIEQVLSGAIESVHSVAAVKGVNIFKVFVEDGPLYVEQNMAAFVEAFKDIVLCAVQCGYVNRSNVVVELNVIDEQAEVVVEICSEDELESIVFKGFEEQDQFDWARNNIEDVAHKAGGFINGDVDISKGEGKIRVSIKMDVFEKVSV